jgi:hypothetical protein
MNSYAALLRARHLSIDSAAARGAHSERRSCELAVTPDARDRCSIALPPRPLRSPATLDIAIALDVRTGAEPVAHWRHAPTAWVRSMTSHHPRCRVECGAGHGRAGMRCGEVA